MAGANSLKSVLYALAANFSIACAKLIAAIVTGSGSMMAESIHSFADTGNQLLLLFGMKRAKQPPSPDFPLGYGKAIYFWSFVVAIVLFSLGGMFSIYEGLHKWHDPQPLSWPLVAIAVLLFGIVAEGVSMWGCLREVNKVRNGRSYFRWFVESRESALIVIFGEDAAALLGLVLALAAVVMTWITGNPLWDAAGSMVIGVLLIVIAIFIGIEVKNLLVGQGVEPATRQKMLDFFQGRDEISHVYNLLTLQLGEDVMVAVKVKMREYDTPAEMISAINQVEADFRKAFPRVLWSFFEPDNKD